MNKVQFFSSCQQFNREIQVFNFMYRYSLDRFLYALFTQNCFYEKFQKDKKYPQWRRI